MESVPSCDSFESCEAMFSPVLLAFVAYFTAVSTTSKWYHATKAFCPFFWTKMLPLLGHVGQPKTVFRKINVTGDNDVWTDKETGEISSKTQTFLSAEFLVLFNQKVKEITGNTGIGTVDMEYDDEENSYVVLSITPVYLLHSKYCMLKQFVADITALCNSNEDKHHFSTRTDITRKKYIMPSYVSDMPYEFSGVQLIELASQFNGEYIVSRSDHFTKLLEEAGKLYGRDITAEFHIETESVPSRWGDTDEPQPDEKQQICYMTLDFTRPKK